MTAVSFTRKPSPWHSKYRTMDDVCQLIRVFRNYRQQEPKSMEWTHDYEDVTDTCELNAVVSFIDFLKVEFKKLGWSFGVDAIGTLTFSPRWYFVYGILDSLQQHVTTTNTGKVAEEIMKAALEIVHESPSKSFIRTKAFEVLASLKISEVSNDMTLEKIENWSNKDTQNEAKEEWRAVKVLVEDMNRKRNKILREQTVNHPCPVTEVAIV